MHDKLLHFIFTFFWVLLFFLFKPSFYWHHTTTTVTTTIIISSHPLPPFQINQHFLAASSVFYYPLSQSPSFIRTLSLHTFLFSFNPQCTTKGKPTKLLEMDSTGICPESRKRELIRELTHGQDLARRLQPLLQKPLGDNGSELVGELLEMILRSFDLGLHQLGPSSDQIGENVLNCSVGHHQISGCDSGDAGEGSEGSSGTKKRPLLRDSRGCYKRRWIDFFFPLQMLSQFQWKPAVGLSVFSPKFLIIADYGIWHTWDPVHFRKSAQTWATVSPTMEDGQAWRKYGQKFILNAKFPRLVYGILSEI